MVRSVPGTSFRRREALGGGQKSRAELVLRERDINVVWTNCSGSTYRISEESSSVNQAEGAGGIRRKTYFREVMVPLLGVEETAEGERAEDRKYPEVRS